ncbi:uncharacterized protein BXZ73DRAFT_99373 [Epithele typhae]|uniref:uncharacterized protein n=1 Tax=Epithele typhae TaxID=378194 RepID=UPI00200816C0|nr:uncharacterized protein BXZ73DRAFT_99373 [Epithele typhae]KAH9939741.1 hypothetical protein BXZ73DRAFT_99373 [Epithele typhae]
MSNTTISSDTRPSLSSTTPFKDPYAAIFSGMYFGFLLCGLVLHQAYRCLRRHYDDKIALRFLVDCVGVFQWMYGAIVIAQVYYLYRVALKGSCPPDFAGRWALDLIPFSLCFGILVSQGYNVRRIHLMERGRRFMTTALVFILGLETGVFAASIYQALSMDATCSWGLRASTVIVMATELLITLGLHKSSAELSLTESDMKVVIMNWVYYVLIPAIALSSLIRSLQGVLTLISAVIITTLPLVLPTTLTYSASGIIAVRLFGYFILVSPRGFSFIGDSFPMSEPCLRPPCNAPSLDAMYGAVLIGTFVGLILYGITLYQSMRFFALYPRESMLLRSLVIGIIVFESIFSVLTMHICYFYLVTNYSHPERLAFGVCYYRSYHASLSSFYTWRVYMIGRKYRLMAMVVALLLIAELAFYIGCTYQAFHIDQLSRLSSISWLLAAGTVTAVVADLLLTLTLVLSLKNSRTGIKETDSLVNTMALYLIYTGLTTGIVASITMIMSLVYPDTLSYSASGIVAIRLYGNSMLAALNGRKALAKRGVRTFGGSDTSPPGTQLQFRTSRGLEHASHREAESVVVAEVQNAGKSEQVVFAKPVTHEHGVYA